MLRFEQTWPSGYTKLPPPPPPPPPPPSVCRAVSIQTDQVGGVEFEHHTNASDAACCAFCLGVAECNVWVTDPATRDCWLCRGASGSKQRSDRNCGFVRREQAGATIGGWPSLASRSPAQLNLSYISWGGCQVAGPHNGAWDGALPGGRFDGRRTGEPLLLHDGKVGDTRALVISPMGSFFSAGQAASASGDALDCGILSSVKSLPRDQRDAHGARRHAAGFGRQVAH